MGIDAKVGPKPWTHYHLINRMEVVVTGGEGSLIQRVHCEFVVSFEAICPVITQWVCGEFF